MSSFTQAVRTARRLRMVIEGPSGSGKTLTALIVAHYFAQHARAAGKPRKTGVIDSETSSASTYAPAPGQAASVDNFTFEFLTCPLVTHEPENYIRKIKEAAAEGVDTLIIDSLSHAWMGTGGILQQVDDMGGGFDKWKMMTPKQQALVKAILDYPGDVICTLRTKTAYEVVENDKGKKAPQKVGTKPEQKEGLDYEFDVVMRMDTDNVGTITKTRCAELTQRAFRHPGEELATILYGWCNSGATAVEDALALARAHKQIEKWVEVLNAHAAKLGGAAPKQLAAALPALIPVPVTELTMAECRALVGSKTAPGPLPQLKDALRAEEPKVEEPSPDLVERWQSCKLLVAAIRSDFGDAEGVEARIADALGPMLGYAEVLPGTDVGMLADVQRRLTNVYNDMTEAAFESEPEAGESAEGAQ